MATYTIELTISDTTEVNASSAEEAYELATTVFTESGYDFSENELSILEIDEEDK